MLVHRDAISIRGRSKMQGVRGRVTRVETPRSMIAIADLGCGTVLQYLYHESKLLPVPYSIRPRSRGRLCDTRLANKCDAEVRDAPQRKRREFVGCKKPLSSRVTCSLAST